MMNGLGCAGLVILAGQGKGKAKAWVTRARSG